VLAAIECCCGAANLAKQLADLGWNISLAHAGFVARMKQNPDKTDFADARILADLVRVGYLPKVWLAPDDIVELRRLVRFRRQLVAERRDVKLRIRALLRDERIKVPTDEGKPGPRVGSSILPESCCGQPRLGSWSSSWIDCRS
jgi:transposase